jgi:hypothetical protein
MPNPEVHYPETADLTSQFNSIVDVEAHPTEVMSAAPVAGELQNVKTFHPSELPKGALLIPKDPTNSKLPRVGEVGPEHAQDTASRLGSVSIAPEADNIVIVEDPQGVQHRLFSVVEPAKIVSWFMNEKGYEFTGLASDESSERPPARHALRDAEAEPELTAVPAQKPRVEAIVQLPQTGQTASDAAEWSWFESFQPVPYPETDQVVTGSHYPSIREALAGESVVDEVVTPSPAPAVEVTADKPEPGDWREALQEKFKGEPLPLGEQLHGIKAAVLAVGPLLSRHYFLAPEQVATALEELDDYTRWQAVFPDHEDYAPRIDFEPFSPKTAGIVYLALKKVVESAPEDKTIAALAGRPRRELSAAENVQLDQMLSLQRLAPVAKAIRANPTLLMGENQETNIPSERNDEPTKLMPEPRHYMDTPLKASSANQTAVMRPTVSRQAVSWLAQKGKSLFNRGVAKLKMKSLRGKQQVVSA